MAKQNVSLAAQLMSHTVATGLRQYLAHDDEALELPQVIETVNNWFDVLNSRTTTESMPFKKPFGLAIDAQLMALQEMNQLISTMRCVGKTSIQVFQRAILMSNKSLQSLFSQMKTIYGIKYVITKHLNQDCLESYFGHIRGKGGMADHPTPLRALQRMKIISMGKQMDTMKRNVNSSESGSHFLIATCLNKVGIVSKISTNEDDDFTDTTLSSVESSRRCATSGK